MQAVVPAPPSGAIRARMAARLTPALFAETAQGQERFWEFFKNVLSELKIDACEIRRAKSVDELRRLNNAIKHERRVNGALAKFSRWKGKEGKELGDLERHYARLQPRAKQYLEDLAKRLKAKFSPDRMKKKYEKRRAETAARS